MKTKLTSLTIAVAVCLVVLGTAQIAAAGAPPPCPPTTITVLNLNDSGPGSLRQAIIDANFCSDANIINFDPGVTGSIILTSGELLVTFDLTINGPGATNLAVNGNFPNTTNRVFNISPIPPDVTVTISGLTITNGAAIGSDGGGIRNGPATLIVSDCTLSGNSTDNSGGGIYNDGTFGTTAIVHIVNSTISGNTAGGVGGGIVNDGVSGNATLTITNSTISGNSAAVGGGVYNDGSDGAGTAVIANSTISGNTAGDGGGIYNDGVTGSVTLTVANSTLTGNSATDGPGGGIFNDGFTGRSTLTVANSTLSGNSATIGGAIYNEGRFGGTGTVQIATSTLSDNSASDSGGGIFNNGEGGSATLTVSNSTLNGNSADFHGGGILNDAESGSATLTIATSTISGNSAGSGGGGIFNDGTFDGTGTVVIANSTLSGNSADFLGGGIFNDGTAGRATLNLGNTILNAGAPENIFDDNSTVTSDGYNLSSDDGGGFLTATGDQINTDPLLGPLADNGGPTFTHALLTGSPAFQAGDPNFTEPPDFDQRGPGFPRVFGGRLDIGAFELQDCSVDIGSLDIDAKVIKKLTKKQHSIDKSIGKGKTKTACKQFQKLIKFVGKQRSKGKLNASQADALTTSASCQRAVLACP